MWSEPLPSAKHRAHNKLQDQKRRTSSDPSSVTIKCAATKAVKVWRNLSGVAAGRLHCKSERRMEVVKVKAKEGDKWKTRGLKRRWLYDILKWMFLESYSAVWARGRTGGGDLSISIEFVFKLNLTTSRIIIITVGINNQSVNELLLVKP